MPDPTPTTTPDATQGAQPTPAAQPTDASAAAQPQQPTTPQAGGTPTQPTQTTPTTSPDQKQQPPQTHDIFKSILKTLDGGPMYVTAPDGSRQEVQRSKGQLGRSILAGALAGLFTPNQYRTGYKDAQVLDRGNTIAAAGQAGLQHKQAEQEKYQQLSDEQQTRKLMTIQNNAKQVQLSAAMAHEKMQDLDRTVDYNQKNLVDPLEEFEKNLPPGEPSIYVAKGGLTADQVLGSGHKLTDGNVFISGSVTKPNEQGVLEAQPTYSIVRNDFSLKLPEATTQELAKFDKRFDNAYKATNGNVMLPINTYLDRIHVANELTNTENFLERANKAINGDDAKPIDLAAAYKKNPALYQKAIEAATHAMAAGQSRDGNDDDVIRAINSSQDCSNLLGLLGKPEDVTKWAQDQFNKREEAYKESVSAGTAKGKAMWTPITATQAPGIIADPNQPPSRRTQAQAVLDIQARQKERLERSEQTIKTGDPNQAGQLLASGDLTLQELKSRGSTPDFIIKATQAANRIDPTYNAQKADEEYSNAKSAQNLAFFGSAKSLTDPGGTIDQLMQAHAALGNTRIPYFNKWEDALSFQAGDPALAAYMINALGVADDYAKVVGGGTPSQEMQLQTLNRINNQLNNGQILAVTNGMRGTVNSQVKSRIGNNRILMRMYGDNVPGINVKPRPTAAPPMTAFVQNGKPIPDGTPVKFANGQTWTLKNGVPTQVKQQPQPQQ